jgi:hypothetical protein
MAYYDITPAQLAQAAITTSYATVYTTPANTRTFVKDITIVNTTSASINIYVSLVPPSGTAGTSNAIFYANALPANTTVDWCGAQILNESGTIQVKASATGCTIIVSGGEAV